MQSVCGFVGAAQQAVFGEVADFAGVSAAACFFADKVIAIFGNNVKRYLRGILGAKNLALDVDGGVTGFRLENLEFNEIAVLPGHIVDFLQADVTVSEFCGADAFEGHLTVALPEARLDVDFFVLLVHKRNEIVLLHVV